MADPDDEKQKGEVGLGHRLEVPHTVEADDSMGHDKEEDSMVKEDKERLASLQLDLQLGPITDFVDSGLSLCLECDHCSCHLTPDSFPLRQGACGHTICDCCYCSHVKEDKGGGLNPACPACKVPNSFERTNCSNEMAMAGVAMIAKLERFAKSSLKSTHSRWKHHVRILEKQRKDGLSALESEVEARERAITGLRGVQRKQAKKMRKELVLAADNLLVANDEIRELDQMLQLHEGGKKLYYLLCPVCRLKMKAMGATKVLSWLQEKQSGVRDGLTVDESVAVKDTKVLEELWKQEAFLEMRNHMLSCIPVDKGRRVKEKDLPPLYRNPGPSDCGDDQSESLDKASKKRRVSFD